MKAKIVISLVALAAVAGFAFFAGCEKTKVNDMVISPSSTYVAQNQTITFTAYNGFNGVATVWSVDNPSWATITPAGANSIYYTSVFDGTGANEFQLQTLHARSTNPDDPTDVKTAEATITFVPPSGITSAGSLFISLAGSNPMSPSTSVTLTASGGTPPYFWSVSDPGVGNVSPSESQTAPYTTHYTTTAVSPGSNTVTVTDSALPASTPYTLTILTQ